jgi:hypothetical protein
LGEALTDRFNIDPTHAQLAARQADGSISRALFSASETGGKYRSLAFEFLHTIHHGTMTEVFERVEQLVASHKDTPMIEGILDVLVEYYSDLFRIVVANDHTMITHSDRSDSFIQMADHLTCEHIESAITAIEDIKYHIMRNVHLQLALTALALRLRKYTRQCP